MGNIRSRSWCEFNPEEWVKETGHDIVYLNTDGEISDFERNCYYKEIGERCPLHVDTSFQTSKSVTRKLIAHFQTGPSDSLYELTHGSILGLEVSGLDLQGRSLEAKADTRIDLRHFINHGETTLSWSKIKNRLNLSGSIFNGDFSATNTHFEGTNNRFTDCHFAEGCSFDAAQFESGVILDNSTIKGDLNLKGVDIQGRLSLNGVKVEGDVLLERANIDGRVEVEGATIEGGLIAPEAEIAGQVRIINTSISDNLGFNGVTIAKDVLLVYSSLEELTLNRSVLRSNWSIHSCSSISEVTAAEMRCSGSLLLQNSKIRGNFSILKSKLDGNIRIIESKIYGKCKFIDTEQGYEFQAQDFYIEDDFDLSGCELGFHTRLKDGRISGDLNIKAANAAGIVIIEDCTVHSDTNLLSIDCAERVSIHKCRFHGDFQLSGYTHEDITHIKSSTFYKGIDARRVDIKHGMIFQDCVLYEETDFSKSFIGGILIFDSNYIFGSLTFESSTLDVQLADFSGARVRNQLSFKDAVVGCSLDFEDSRVGAVNISGARIEGDVAATSITHQSFDASNCQIEGNCVFVQANVEEELNLSKSKIGGVTDLSKCNIHQECRMTETTIERGLFGYLSSIGALYLESATISSNILLHETQIEGDFSAIGITHTGKVINCDQVSIGGQLNFDRANVSGDIVIEEATINGEVIGTYSTIKGQIEAKNLTLGSSFNWKDSDVHDELVLENSTIQGSIDLTEASIAEELRLAGTTIERKLILEHAHIKSHLQAPRARLGERITLQKGVIDGEIDLTNCTLSSGGNFVDLRAGSKVKFSEAKIFGEADFSDALFKWDVLIEGTYFQTSPKFTRAEFRNRLKMAGVKVGYGAVILDQAIISKGAFSWNGNSEVVFDLSEANVGEVELEENPPLPWPQIVINQTQFNRFNFSRHSDSLEKTDFRIHPDARNFDSLRDRATGFLATFGRNIVQSLREPDAKKALIRGHDSREITYRRAKDNANTVGDNPAASEFYILEKKHRRRRQFWEILDQSTNVLGSSLRYFLNLSLGLIAGHGERPMRVIGSSMLTVMIFAVMFWYLAPVTGFDISSDPIALTIKKGNPLTYINQSFGSFVSLVYWQNPTPDTQTVRLLTQIERAFGAGYIALLIFTLSRSLYR